MTAQPPQPFEEQIEKAVSWVKYTDEATMRPVLYAELKAALIAAHQAEMTALLNRVEGKKQNATIYDAGKNNEPRETLAVTLADIRALKAELNDTSKGEPNA